MLFDSSIRKELARAFGATLVVMLTIVLTMVLIRMLGQAAKGSVAPADVSLALGYTVIAQLPMLLNLSLFVAVVSGLSRMYRDSEMVVWFASGQRLGGFVRPVLRMSWPVVLGMAALVGVVRPWAQEQSAELRDRFERRSDLARVAAGQFQASRDGRRVFFIDRDSDEAQIGRNVFILSRTPGQESVTTAREGRIVFEDGNRLLQLEHGQRVILDDQRGQQNVARFDEARVLVGDATADGSATASVIGRGTLDLLADLSPAARGELVWRAGQVLTMVNLLLLAIGLASGGPRQASNWNLLLALLTYVVYFNLLNLSQAWVSTGRFSAGPTLVAVHGGVLVVALARLWWRDGGAARWGGPRLARAT